MKQFTSGDVLTVLAVIDIDHGNPRLDEKGMEASAANCWYGDPPKFTKPSCIVGTIVYKLDADLWTLIRRFAGGWASVPDHVRRCFDDDCEELFLQLQRYADNPDGHTWRTCMENVGMKITTTRTVELWDDTAIGVVEQ